MKRSGDNHRKDGQSNRGANGDGSPRTCDGSLRRIAQADAAARVPRHPSPIQTRSAHRKTKGRQIALPPPSLSIE
jgi:hypothetical protein